MPMFGPTFSPDGRLAAVADDLTRQIRIWDVDTGKEVRSLPIGKDGEGCEGAPVWYLVFTEDQRLLTAGNNGIRLWNLNDGTEKPLRPPCSGETYANWSLQPEESLALDRGFR